MSTIADGLANAADFVPNGAEQERRPDDPAPASSVTTAERAVADAIVKAANTATAATDLKLLAEAVGAMKHGPQGGHYRYAGRYDEHRHHHDRPLDRNTGFGR